MDWYSFLWGFVFVLTGVILLLIWYQDDSKESSWLDIGNAGLISGGVFGIIIGLYVMISSL
jgi:hypothetical protein